MATLNQVDSFFDLARRVVVRFFNPGMALLLVAGCTSYGVIDNRPTAEGEVEQAYSIEAMAGRKGSGDVSLMLAFSGGGTRAAALAYGVLQELRDTAVESNGRSHRMLDEVDTISSVSGGSFTSAYYGLFGDRIFDDFEDAFLRRNFQGELIEGLFNPLHWFSPKGRTEMAVRYYQQEVFHDATFADMRKAGGPLILINASDLGYGVRFSFVQEYFNLLCSEISSFPVARAVAASSAVPVLFNPVVVANYQHCKDQEPDWLTEAANRAEGDARLTSVVDGLKSYFRKEDREYAHFVDGGITDNLGLRAIYESLEIAGGAKAFVEVMGGKSPRSLVIISVNASTDPEPTMDKSNRQPSVSETINAMSDVQLHRYNVDTLELVNNQRRMWAQEISTPDRPAESYFIQVSFRDIKEPERLKFFNRVPTSFDLSDEQVDNLIEAGRELLRNNPEFKRFLSNFESYVAED